MTDLARAREAAKRVAIDVATWFDGRNPACSTRLAADEIERLYILPTIRAEVARALREHQAAVVERDEARAALAAAEAERDRGNQALALMEEAQERERVLAKAVEDVALEDLKPCVDAFDGKDMADVPTYVQTALGRLRAALEAREVSP